MSPGVGCKPLPETHLPCISQSPPLPCAQAAHLVLSQVACDPARKGSEGVFPCRFSHFFKEKREAEERRRWEEKWTPSCSLQGRLWRNKQLTLLTGGGERKVEPVCRSWIFLAPTNPSWSNRLSHLTPFTPLSETNHLQEAFCLPTQTCPQLLCTGKGTEQPRSPRHKQRLLRGGK